jgi:hypothetical protein
MYNSTLKIEAKYSIETSLTTYNLYISLCNLLNVNRRFGGICRLHPQNLLVSIDRLDIFTLVSLLAYSTLNMEVTCSSETSVDFQRTIRRCIHSS